MLMWKNVVPKKWIRPALCVCFCLAFRAKCQAFQGYNVVITTDVTCENQFLENNQAQFEENVTTNPFVADTYQISLLGLNPNYVLPGQVVPSQPCQLDQDIATMIANSSTTYLYGWRDGATYFQQNEISFVGATANLCQGATNFTLVNATTTTWNKATCQDALAAVINQLFAVNTGTPTVIPGEP